MLFHLTHLREVLVQYGNTKKTSWQESVFAIDFFSDYDILLIDKTSVRATPGIPLKGHNIYEDFF